jgi:hypothetical protein
VRKRGLAIVLILVGVAVATIGYAEPTLIGQGARPYAYISVMAVGAMCAIAGAMLYRDS